MLIARCLIESDVQASVRFAAEHRMLLSVRGGGHHNAGNAVAEGGMMLDLSGMRAITIDAEKRTARVGGGALLGDYLGMNLNIEPAAVPQHRGGVMNAARPGQGAGPARSDQVGAKKKATRRSPEVLVERMRIELTTSALRTRRSPS